MLRIFRAVGIASADVLVGISDKELLAGVIDAIGIVLEEYHAVVLDHGPVHVVGINAEDLLAGVVYALGTEFIEYCAAILDLRLVLVVSISSEELLAGVASTQWHGAATTSLPPSITMFSFMWGTALASGC